MELLEFEARWRGGRPQGIKGGRLGGRPRSPDRPIASRLIEDVRSASDGARPLEKTVVNGEIMKNILPKKPKSWEKYQNQNFN